MVLGISASWEEWRAAKRAKARSDDIDRQIKEEDKTFKKCDVLLMGVNGPTTLALFRQMKILYNDGYSHKELVDFRLSIWRYLLETSRRIVQDLRNVGLEPANHANKANCERILDHPTNINHPEFCFQPGFAEAVQELWEDDIIPVLFERSKYYHSTDNAAYNNCFFLDAHRITSKEYIPSNSDILRAPAQVQMGAMETHLPMGQLLLRLYHVVRLGSGGRNKWIHFFANMTSIIFCTSLPDYDRCDEHGVRLLLLKSLDLFESLINSRWFLRTSIILFLTGLEEFKAKLLKVPLENYFPEYTGGADVNKAARYILWRFMQTNRAGLNVYSHITDVFDASSIRLVFVTVKETILHNALKNSGIL